MGGGRKFFLPANGTGSNKGVRLDGRNLIEVCCFEDVEFFVFTSKH
jgi:hypothetical protein